MPEERHVHTHILLEPPPADKAEGKYPLGAVTYADNPVCTFGIMPNNVPQHVLMVGRPETGKTNVGYLIVWNLLRANKPFTVLDWRANYRHLLSRPEGKYILFFHQGEGKSLSFNPLDPPPNLTQDQHEGYIRDIISVICTAYLPSRHRLRTCRVEYLLLRTIERLTGGGGKPITFNDIRNYIEHYEVDSREKDWKASALNTLRELTTGPIGRLTNSDVPTTAVDIIDRRAILELDSLTSESDRILFTRTFLVWLYYHRLAEGKSQTLKHALIVEEAYHLFLRRSHAEQSLQDMMLRQMTGLGQTLVFLDRDPRLTYKPALGNTAVIICLNLRYADDWEAAGKVLTLPCENWDYVSKLPVGHAIIKSQDRPVSPFLVRFPRFPRFSHARPPRPEERRSRNVSLQQAAVEIPRNTNNYVHNLPGIAGTPSKHNLSPLVYTFLCFV